MTSLYDSDIFPLNRIAEIQQHPQDFRLLERIPFTRDDILERVPLPLVEQQPNERVFSVIFLDTETTGLNYAVDKVIELGMVKCKISLDRNIILSIEQIFDAYEDPKQPLSATITSLTGITDEMVRGKRFDDNAVLQFFNDNPLVIAHNAKFDRPFVERRFPNLAKCPWACSYQEIKWSERGFAISKLEFILEHEGFFYTAHRADIDCLALCFLMYVMPEAFDELIKSSLQTTYKVEAYNCPFHQKEALKEQRYSWDGPNKVWYINVMGESAVEEQVRFLEHLYPDARNSVQVTAFTAFDRYKG